jgi:hypothetical protein
VSAMNDATEPLDVVQVVTEIVERAIATQPEERLHHEIGRAISELPGIENLGGVHFRYDEYDIHVSSLWHPASNAEELSSMREFALTSAPEVVSLLKAGERGAVLITRYAACAGEKLLPVRDMWVTFGEEARRRFLRDMQTLIERGLHHPYAARGFYHWYVSSRTGTIVLDSWSAVRPCEPAEGAKALQKIERMLLSGHEG